MLGSPLASAGRSAIGTVDTRRNTTGCADERVSISRTLRRPATAAETRCGEIPSTAGVLGRRGDELVGDPLCDVGGVGRWQSEDDVLEAGVDRFAAGEILPDMDAYELLRGVGNLCIGADNNPRYDARRMVELVIAGLRLR